MEHPTSDLGRISRLPIIGLLRARDGYSGPIASAVQSARPAVAVTWPPIGAKCSHVFRAFCPGLLPSGTTVQGKTRIGTRGSCQMRRRLFEATLSAARYNPTRTRSCEATRELLALASSQSTGRLKERADQRRSLGSPLRGNYYSSPMSSRRPAIPTAIHDTDPSSAGTCKLLGVLSSR